jgi:hypothetical protein
MSGAQLHGSRTPHPRRRPAAPYGPARAGRELRRSAEAVIDLDVGAARVTVHLRGALGARSAAALRVVFSELYRCAVVIHVHTGQAASVTREVLAVVSDAQLKRRSAGLPPLQLCPDENPLHDLMPVTWVRRPARRAATVN